MSPDRTVVEDCAVESSGAAYQSGHVAIEGNVFMAVGEGRAPEELELGARQVDGSKYLDTSGLVNRHQPYQRSTRELAQANGESAVESGELGTADESDIARESAQASKGSQTRPKS